MAISKDSDIRQKFESCKNFEEFYNMCRDLIPEITKEKLSKEILKLSRECVSEVEDNMLEKVSGGNELYPELYPIYRTDRYN